MSRSQDQCPGLLLDHWRWLGQAGHGSDLGQDLVVI